MTEQKKVKQAGSEVKPYNRRNTIRAVSIALLVILAFVAFITIPMAAKKRISSEFHFTRALYEACLHEIEGYVPEDSPISHVTVWKGFLCENKSGSNNYKNRINISVYLKDEMRDCFNKQALLKLYPHDVKIRALINSVKDQSGFGPWIDENMKDYTIYVDGKRGKVWDEINIRYVIDGNPQIVYDIGSETFKVYCSGDRTEYSYRIDDNTLVKFDKTYPVYVQKKSTWDPDKNNSKQKNSSSTGSSSKKSGSSGKSSSKKKYDYYHADDYDSAWDFANDKYEEFYDYEDDYEDEDEAFDAAEEYWYDHHE